MGTGTRARYTLEFKLEALRLAKTGQNIAATAKILGLSEQTLHNWIRAEQQGRLGGPGAKSVSPEQMVSLTATLEPLRDRMIGASL